MLVFCSCRSLRNSRYLGCCRRCIFGFLHLLFGVGGGGMNVEIDRDGSGFVGCPSSGGSIFIAGIVVVGVSMSFGICLVGLVKVGVGVDFV